MNMWRDRETEVGGRGVSGWQGMNENWQLLVFRECSIYLFAAKHFFCLMV